MITELPNVTEGNLKLVPEEMRAYWKEKPVKLTHTMFLLLYDLAKNPERLRTRERLLNYAWGTEIFVEERTVDSMVKRLRQRFKAVDEAFDQIETTYKVGYRWKKETTQ